MEMVGTVKTAETLGGFLRGVRHARRLSLGQLSLRSGVTKATLSRWETGAAFPRIPELLRVLDALDATPAHRTRCLSLLDAPRALLAQRTLGASSPLSLGDLLYGLRQRAGTTKTDIARAVGVSRALYYQWENDATRPSDSQLHAVGFALHASGDEVAALSSRPLSQSPADKSRDSLLSLYDQTKSWNVGVTEASYTLHLLFLLASFGRLVKLGKADVGDVALIVYDCGNCVELWQGDVPQRIVYHKRALKLAEKTREPLHFHMIGAVRSHLLVPPRQLGPGAPPLATRVREALAWQARFPTRAGQAYLLMFIASVLAHNAPSEALKMADTYCALVADDAHEYACRARDKGNLLAKCGRHAEAIALLSRVVPQDVYRAGLIKLDIAQSLMALGTRAEARTCVDEAKRLLLPVGNAFTGGIVEGIERHLD